MPPVSAAPAATQVLPGRTAVVLQNLPRGSEHEGRRAKVVSFDAHRDMYLVDVEGTKLSVTRQNVVPQMPHRPQTPPPGPEIAAPPGAERGERRADEEQEDAQGNEAGELPTAPGSAAESLAAASFGALQRLLRHRFAAVGVPVPEALRGLAARRASAAEEADTRPCVDGRRLFVRFRAALMKAIEDSGGALAANSGMEFLYQQDPSYKGIVCWLGGVLGVCQRFGLELRGRQPCLFLAFQNQEGGRQGADVRAEGPPAPAAPLPADRGAGLQARFRAALMRAIEDAGGSLAATSGLAALYRQDPGYKAVVDSLGAARGVCREFGLELQGGHPAWRLAFPGGGAAREEQQRPRPRPEADVVRARGVGAEPPPPPDPELLERFQAALFDAMRANGGRLCAGSGIDGLYRLDPAFRDVVKALGMVRGVCDRFQLRYRDHFLQFPDDRATMADGRQPSQAAEQREEEEPRRPEQSSQDGDRAVREREEALPPREAASGSSGHGRERREDTPIMRPPDGETGWQEYFDDRFGRRWWSHDKSGRYFFPGDAYIRVRSPQS